jgi:catechol 2,3-dioxygenase-like lactoylglutathione lyase family enzyme
MPRLETAWGYQGNNMNLPVRDLDAAVPFYETVLGFALESRQDTPVRSAVLARDQIRIALAENGGDPSQDGCAFRVQGLEDLLTEFQSRGLQKDAASAFSTEQRNGTAWKVFFVVAPDGLCYWFGEPQPQ